MSNSHVQSAKAIAEDIAHLCCVPDDGRLQISDLAAWPFPTLCATNGGFLGFLRRFFCRAVQIPPFCKEGIPICKHLWERGGRGVDGPEEGNEVLPYGWVQEEMVPQPAKGILWAVANFFGPFWRHRF